MVTRTQQGLAKCAALAVGLAAALAACGPGTPSDTGALGGDGLRSDDVQVARVDGTAIFLSDVERAAAGQGLVADGTILATDDPVFRNTLEELVDQRLLALDALRQGLDRDEEARRRLLAARERILGNYAVEQALAQAVSEPALRELYDAQNSLLDRGPERLVRTMTLDTEAEARAALERLRDEEDFADVAADLSGDREDGDGTPGWVSRDQLDEALRDAVFALPVGGRSGPLQAGDAVVVAEVLDARTPGARPFEDVREDLERFLTIRTLDSMISELRDEADIAYTLEETEADAEAAAGATQEDAP